MMDEKKITISTFGSCVTRDIFRICDKENKFQAIRNVGFISPISFLKKITVPTSELQEQISNCNASGFAKRNILLDICGGGYSYLIEKPSEWLIIDMLDIRLSLMRKENEVVSIRKYQIESDLIQQFLKENGYVLTQPSDISESELKLCLCELCNKLKEKWNPNKIILIEAYPVRKYLAKDGKIDQSGYFDSIYENSYDYPKLFHLANRYVKENLKCHCISLPCMQYVLASTQHSWGASPLHYTDIVYEYFYDAINSIVFSGYQNRQYEILESIKEQYYFSISNKIVASEKNYPLSDVELELLSTDSCIEYLDRLKMLSDCVVFLTVKDTVGSWFKEEIQSKMFDLGLTENLIKKYTVGYIAIVKEGVVIHEKCSQRDGYEVYFGNMDYVDVAIISKSYKTGNMASICINGKDYAVNRRGLNIVVFDLNRNAVIDSIAFDTHTPKLTCTRNRNYLHQDDIIRIDMKKISKKLDLICEYLGKEARL